MATQQLQVVLSDGQTKADTASGSHESDRGSIAWVRRIVEKFRSSQRPQTLTVTPFGHEVVQLSAETAKDKVYCIRKNIFLAMRGAFPVPPEAQKVYDDKIKYRLMKDLDKAWKSIESEATSGRRSARAPNQFISERLELRMSGRASGGRDGRVELVPTIWVRCSKHQRASLEKALRDKSMDWAHKTEFGEIMVGDAAKLLSSEGPGPYEIPIGRGMLLDLPRGPATRVTLHLEIEDVATRTQGIEGISCRATLMQGGVVRSQKISTIGGVLSIGGRPFGLTIAHAMLGNLWDTVCGLDDGVNVIWGDIIAQDDPQLDPSELADLNNSLSQDSSDEEDFSCYAEFAKAPLAPSVMPRKWIAVDLGHAANFLGLKAISVKGEGVSPSIIFVKDALKSDYALIELDNISKPFPGEISPGAKAVDTGSKIDPGPVSIRLGGEEVSAPGSSGAWAVRDNVLCGMIIAGYEAEPYAHMIPAGQLIGDIKNSLTEATDVTTFNGSLAECILKNNKKPAPASLAVSQHSSTRDPPAPELHIHHDVLDDGDLGTVLPQRSPDPASQASVIDHSALDPISSDSHSIASLRGHSIVSLHDSTRLFDVTGSGPGLHPATMSPPLADASAPTRIFLPAAVSPALANPPASAPARTSLPGHYDRPERQGTRLMARARAITRSIYLFPSRIYHLETSYDIRWRLSRLKRLFIPISRVPVNPSADGEAADSDAYRTQAVDGDVSRDGTYWSAWIVKELDSMDFNKKICIRAALDYFAAWYNLFAVTLATSLLDFGHTIPDGSRTTLLSGIIVLSSMTLGMLSSGFLANWRGIHSVSAPFRVVLFAGIVGMTAIGAGMGPIFIYLIVISQGFIGLGVGCLTILPAVVVVEYASTRTRSTMLTLVLAMQGFALLAVYGIAALVLVASAGDASGIRTGSQEEGAVDRTRRIVSAFGAIPVVVAIIFRWLEPIPESPRFLLEARDSSSAAKNAVQALRSGLGYKANASKPIDRFQWFRGLCRRLARKEHNGQRLFYHRNRLALILSSTTFSLFYLNVAVFGMALENPQALSSTWGVTSSAYTVARDRDSYYIRAEDARSLLQGWTTTLGALAAPAIVGYIARHFLARLLQRHQMMRYSSLVALPSLLAFGIELFRRQSRQQAALEMEDKNNNDGIFVLVMYAVFQFSMSFAPSALQFAFAAEVFPTRYRAALLGISSALGMLGAIIIRLIVVNVGIFKRMPSIVTFISAGAVFYVFILLWFLYPQVDKRVPGKVRPETLTLEEIAGTTQVSGDLEMTSMTGDVLFSRDDWRSEL